MLKPCPDDPNYKAELKRWKENPPDWSGNAAERNLGAMSPAQAAREQRGYVIEVLRRELLVHHGINPTNAGVAERSQPAAETLFVQCGEDDKKARAHFDDPQVIIMLRAAGFSV